MPAGPWDSQEVLTLALLASSCSTISSKFQYWSLGQSLRDSEPCVSVFCWEEEKEGDRKVSDEEVLLHLVLVSILSPL